MNASTITNAYDGAHSHYPYGDGAPRPRIGITANFGDRGAELAEGYYASVLAAGGTPVILPPTDDPTVLVSMLDAVDALLLSGGGDINPLLLGQEPIPQLRTINPRRDVCELLLARLADDRQMPMLGICRGIQVLVAVLGGTVLQDIAAQHTTSTLIKHSQDLDRAYPSHTVAIAPGTTLAAIYAADPNQPLPVNSFHHQAVGNPGPHLRVAATAADGVIEAVESIAHKSIVGVQWHPECFILRGDDSQMPLFRWLVGEARSYASARRFHATHVTVDSHCDTPMFFDQDIHFDRRDPRILVDLHKMTEGGLDATTMVAYIPQGPLTNEGRDVAFALANARLDGIQAIASHPSVAIVHDPADLPAVKASGRRAILPAIENGYAIGQDLSRLDHFARRGIVYMTLCHNGNNDICGSARPREGESAMGLTDFGRAVVARMNDLGIAVDLSHAGETTFYDALEASRVPVLCSHSSARALCDHPRNLTDDQLRAIARAGGVAQATFYDGFLRAGGGADIDDAERHILHMARVAGVEHIGIGTDFDGDGGVPGLASASELVNLTRRLQRHFNADDLALLWGGNYLRLLAQVQAAARTAIAVLACCFLTLLAPGCTSRPSRTPEAVTVHVSVPPFSADTAMQYIITQCDFGPRVPATAAHDACAEWIAAQFAAHGASVINHSTSVTGYDGTALPCRNIMARVNADATARILITAHYDSRAWADNDPDEARHRDPVPAANDGASGIAVMLELARVMQDSLPAIGVDFVCFDVEDQGHPQWADDYDEEADEAGFWCLGSRAWAEEAFNRGYTARFAINLDMVGGRGARFCQESYSRRYAASIVDLVWRTAAAQGHGDLFPATVGGYVMDDHVPVMQLARIPAIDIIPNVDGQRSSFGDTWHTLADTPDAIDPDVLAAVGETLLNVVYSLK